MAKGSGGTRLKSPSERKQDWLSESEYSQIVDNIAKGESLDFDKWQILNEDQQALALMEAGFTGAVDDINSGMLYYPDTKKNMVELFVDDLVNEMSGTGMDDSTTYSILYNDGTRKYLSNDDPSDFVSNNKIRSGFTKKIYSDAKNALKISKVEAIIRSDGYNQPTYYISKGNTTDGETAMRKYGFELWKNGRGDKKRDYIQDDWV